MRSDGFIRTLKQELVRAQGNWHSDNYDFVRFDEEEITFNRRVKNILLRSGIYGRLLCSGVFDRQLLGRTFDSREQLQYFYEHLSDEASRELLKKLIAFRLLGHRKVRLPLSSPKYWAAIDQIKMLADDRQSLVVPSVDWKLVYIDLHPIGIPVRLFYTPKGTYTTFCLPHYQYAGQVAVKPGDVVLDLGGCFGDTALFFADRVEATGRVHSFEFIPENLTILKKNLALNPELATRVKIVEQPVWQQSHLPIWYSDRGPASKVSFAPFPDADGTKQTISLDDYVAQNHLECVDFVKMDIEGAEQPALAGAQRTISTFRPRLAISIYHSMDDFLNILRHLHELGLGYQFFLGHASIHHEETVLFARPPQTQAAAL